MLTWLKEHFTDILLIIAMLKDIASLIAYIKIIFKK